MSYRNKKTGRYDKRKWAGVLVVLGAVVFLGAHPIINNWLGNEIDATPAIQATQEIVAPQTAHADETQQALAQQIIDKKIKAAQDGLLDTLEQCESHNNTDPQIQYDNNKEGTLPAKEVPSLGGFRFKVGTVEGYENQLYRKKLSDSDAISLAVHEPEARELARDMIFKIPGALDNWKHCTDWHELKARLQEIQSFSK